jgi:hypothetical protein
MNSHENYLLNYPRRARLYFVSNSMFQASSEQSETQFFGAKLEAKSLIQGILSENMKTLSLYSDRLRTGQPVSIPARNKRFFSTPQCPDILWGTIQSSNQCVLGAVSQGVKWPWHEADHSPLLVSRLRMVELYLDSPRRLHVVLVTWAQGQVYLFFYHADSSGYVRFFRGFLFCSFLENFIRYRVVFGVVFWRIEPLLCKDLETSNVTNVAIIVVAMQ